MQMRPDPSFAVHDHEQYRLERGISHDAHVRRLARAAGLAAGHRLIQLAGVGHAARDVFTASQTRSLMVG
jgi:hypothetical protein